TRLLKHANQVRNTNVRDFQRGRLYKWEASEWWMAKTGGLSLLEAQILCRSLTDLHITIKDGRGRRHAAATRAGNAIFLPRWARTVPIVCHEVAHLLSNDKHGPEFVAQYCLLLEKSGLVPSARVVRMSAIDSGLVVAEL
ncbi:MAG: hypothetical protein ACWA5Q_06285, partial [bacterium]